MNLRQLKYFLKVVELGSMTRAAEQLHVAQPALGMQIRQLEEDVGVALLVRHSRGVEPTAAGALLRERAAEILALVAAARRDVAGAGRDRSESIRLGLTPALMRVLGPEIALRMREDVPQVFLSLGEEMSHVMVETLLRGEIDFGLAYDVPDSPALVRRPLLRESLVLVTLPGVGRGRDVTFPEAMEETLVLPEPRDTVRELVMRTARDAGIEPRVEFVVRSIPAMRSLILRGVAAGVLPLAAVAEDVADGRLAARRIVAPVLQRTLYLVQRAQGGGFRHEPGVTAVIRGALVRLTDLLGPLAEPVGPGARPSTRNSEGLA